MTLVALRRAKVLVAGFAILAMAGCSSMSWGWQREKTAEALDNNAPLKLCLLNNGIDDTSKASACYRDSADQTYARACVAAAYGEESIPVFKRCTLEEAAREQIATHNSTCYRGLLGAVNCTSN